MNKFRHIVISLFCLIIPELTSNSQEINLEYFINNGISHSPVLKDLHNQISTNTIDSLLIKAGQKPQVSYNGLLYYAPVINGTGYSEVITNISNITSVIYASQQIFNQKTIDAQYQKLGIQNQSLRISSKISENDLRKAITLQYLSVCAVSNDIAFYKQLLASYANEEGILKQLVEKGLYKQVDYNSFMLEYKSQDLLLRDLKIEYQKEISSLNVICGLPDVIYEDFDLPVIGLNSPVNTGNSVYLKKYLVDSLNIENEKLLIDRNYKPSVKWFSDAGIINNIPRELNKNPGFSIGLNLTVPIYDGKQRKLNYEKLRISENTRINYEESFRQQYNTQLHQLLAEMNQTREIIPRLEEQLAFSESVIKQNTYLLNSGNISITEYLTALKSYISVKRNLSIYQIKILQIITEINYWNQ